MSNEATTYEELRKALANAFIANGEASFPALEPSFLYNDRDDRIKVIDAIRDELEKCLAFSFSVAFITKGGYQLLKEALRNAKERGVHGRILTTDYLSFTDPDVLLDIKENFPNIELKIFKTLDTNNDGFHTKGYIFKEKGDGDEFYKAIIGSSNLTDKALTTNKEWNTSLVSTKDGRFIQEVLFQFDLLWERANRLDEYIDQYKSIFEKQRQIEAESKKISQNANVILRPNPMQTRFVKNLLDSVHHGHKRGLLISATGTGKTYASAFGIRELNPKRVLFLAHRTLLLRQAISAYRNVMPKSKKFAIYSGEKSKDKTLPSFDPSNPAMADFVFSTSELLSKPSNLEKFPKDTFDVIVIDEVHKAGSHSYQRIYNHFSPKFVLGMSATPERSDDANLIFSMFDHNILYEIRLKDALELDLLCPFHYYGISDLKGIDDKTYEKSEFNKLYSEERISYIIKESNFYGYSGSRLKGLIFVSRAEEGSLLSEKLNQKGYKTAFLSGNDNTEKREKTIELLEKDDISDGEYLDYIITVDIFNEGVDIPSVNQVLLLRPTESSIIFIQQLGRGLRKYADKDYVVVIDFIGNYDSNFMIPKAFSYNGDKEAARKVMSNGGSLPGISTIEFDEKSKEKIYKSISKASFNTKREFKAALLSLANKLNRLPKYRDFIDYTDFEPERIIAKFGSYYSFLCEIKEDLPSFIKLPLFNDYEIEALKAIGSSLGMGIRIEEPLFLLRLIEGKSVSEYENELFVDHKKLITNEKRECMKKIFTGKWDPNNKFRFIDEDLSLTKEFTSSLMTNKDFYLEVLSLLDYQLDRYNRLYSDSYLGSDLSLYAQYSYRDVCQALNYDSNLTSVIGGYKYDKKTNTCPVFINYDKDPSLESSTNYADKFINRKSLSWESKKNRKLDSKELSPIIDQKEMGTEIYLFVRKANIDKDVDSKKFFFLGKITKSGEAKEVMKEVIEKGQKKKLSYVDMNFLLEHEVRKDIYDYLTSNIKEGD